MTELPLEMAKPFKGLEKENFRLMKIAAVATRVRLGILCERDDVQHGCPDVLVPSHWQEVVKCLLCRHEYRSSMVRH